MNLQVARQNIDDIDKELINLLEKRLSLVSNISVYKKNNDIAVLDPSREAQILKNLQKQVQDKQFEATIINSFLDIMKHSREYQKAKIKGLE